MQEGTVCVVVIISRTIVSISPSVSSLACKPKMEEKECVASGPAGRAQPYVSKVPKLSLYRVWLSSLAMYLLVGVDNVVVVVDVA